MSTIGAVGGVGSAPRVGVPGDAPRRMTRRDAVALLSAAGVPTPEVDVRWLWRLVPPERLEDVVAARSRRVPLQHLLGTVCFRHLELLCDRRALVPRPETEVTAGVAVAALPARATCLDLCTGSGPIALSVASEVPGVRVVGTDVSAGALALAAENARRCGLSVDLRRGDLFEAVDGERFDVIVANPPYLSEDEIVSLEPEVRDHDPRQALVAGRTGLEVIERILDGAPRHLAAGGTLVVEIAPHQARWASRFGEVLTDLAGRPRVMRLRT